MMLDDLMKVIPGLRRFRSLDADLLRRLLDRQKGECTWCGTAAPRPRTKWCSDRCVAEFKERCDPTTYRNLAIERDGMVCRECGRDIVAAQAAAEREAEENFVKFSDWRVREAIFKRHGMARGQWFEVDHIVPVVEGGGLCGIDNLRVVCGACHAVATKRLSRRRAR